MDREIVSLLSHTVSMLASGSRSLTGSWTLLTMSRQPISYSNGSRYSNAMQSSYAASSAAQNVTLFVNEFDAGVIDAGSAVKPVPFTTDRPVAAVRFTDGDVKNVEPRNSVGAVPALNRNATHTKLPAVKACAVMAVALLPLLEIEASTLVTASWVPADEYKATWFWPAVGVAPPVMTTQLIVSTVTARRMFSRTKYAVPLVAICVFCGP